MPEAALDLLAWQLHVERYETAASLAAKRAMVFASVILHRKRGTPWAVRYGLETTLGTPARVEEWFAYGGEPYFFRVYLDVSGASLNAASMENAVKVIMAHKNVRSWLEYLRTFSRRGLPLKIAGAGAGRTKVQAFAWRWAMTAEKLPAFACAGAVEKTRVQTTPAQRWPDAGKLRLRPGLAGNTFTKTEYGA